MDFNDADVIFSKIICRILISIVIDFIRKSKEEEKKKPNEKEEGEKSKI